MLKTLLFVSVALAVAPTALVPEPIERFVGVSWSGIRIGATTDADIKKTFGTEKGAIRPEALLVKAAPGSPRVDALLDGRGAKAKVTAIRLEYPSDGPRLSNLESALAEKSVAYYFPGRIENWSLRVFQARGIAAFVLDEVASVVLLLPPAHVPELVGDLSAEPTEVEEYDPRFTDEELSVEYGEVDLNFTSSGVDFRRKNDVVNDIEDELRRRTRGNFLDYNPRAEGTLNASVSLRWDERRKTYTIEATLHASGRNALGSVSASGQSSDRWTRVVARPRIDSSRDVLNVVEDARAELERNFDAAVRKQRPPTKEEIRRATWARIINRATAKL